MASMGLKYMAWADIAAETTTAVPTYNAGLVLGKAVSVNVSVSNAEGEVYADDALAEYISEFSSGELTAEVDNISLENQAKLYGATYASDEFKLEPTDSAPHGGVGGIQVLLVNNTRKFRAWFFPKVRASMPDWDAATKGSSISFGTQPIKMKIMAPAYGRGTRQEFTTKRRRRLHRPKLGVATWYTSKCRLTVRVRAKPRRRSVTAVAGRARSSCDHRHGEGARQRNRQHRVRLGGTRM